MFLVKKSFNNPFIFNKKIIIEVYDTPFYHEKGRKNEKKYYLIKDSDELIEFNNDNMKFITDITDINFYITLELKDSPYINIIFDDENNDDENKFSHISEVSNKPKVDYDSINCALSALKTIFLKNYFNKKILQRYTLYKCKECNNFHIGKDITK